MDSGSSGTSVLPGPTRRWQTLEAAPRGTQLHRRKNENSVEAADEEFAMLGSTTAGGEGEAMLEHQPQSDGGRQ